LNCLSHKRPSWLEFFNGRQILGKTQREKKKTGKRCLSKGGVCLWFYGELELPTLWLEVRHKAQRDRSFKIRLSSKAGVFETLSGLP
jgi:hypothetical protein